jgi:hypothetical protein
MNQLRRISPPPKTVRDVQRWVLSMLPRREPPSAMPGVLAGLGLVILGAAAALLLSPRTGSELRGLARKQIGDLRRRASDFAESHDLTLRRGHNGRGSQSQGRSQAT